MHHTFLLSVLIKILDDEIEQLESVLITIVNSKKYSLIRKREARHIGLKVFAIENNDLTLYFYEVEIIRDLLALIYNDILKESDIRTKASELITKFNFIHTEALNWSKK